MGLVDDDAGPHAATGLRHVESVIDVTLLY